MFSSRHCPICCQETETETFEQTEAKVALEEVIESGRTPIRDASDFDIAKINDISSGAAALRCSILVDLLQCRGPPANEKLSVCSI